MLLPINIEKLLSGKIVENERIEFKTGWNPTTVMRTVCAFANDFENLGSGYVIIGVEEKDGRAVRPVKGINPNNFEKIQKEMIGYSNLIEPTYSPRLFLEDVDDKQVLVIWVPGGSNRPYRVPDDVLAKHKNYNYRIRMYSSSIIPSDEQERELVQLTARIPYDDRVNTNFGVDELDFGLMREHLYKTKSKLADASARMTNEELAKALNLCEGGREHLFPKNVGLLMFTPNPKKYFPNIQIDVVRFPYGIGSKEFNEKIFEGPIQKQLLDVLSYLRTNIVKSKVIKFADRAEAKTIYNYPYAALEEALANAVYHRNYELREPIELRILPDKIEIISYNGVDPSIKQSDFEKGVIRVRRYRNRRIGEFLKELELTEGRGTGIPTIYEVLKKNGSPNPLFDTDEQNRAYFVIEILLHSEFKDSFEGEPVYDENGEEIEKTSVAEVSNRPISEKGIQLDGLNRPISEKRERLDGLNRPISEKRERLDGLNRPISEKGVQLDDPYIREFKQETLDLLGSSDILTTRMLRERLGASKSMAALILSQLTEEGILKRFGKGSSTHYKLKEDNMKEKAEEK